MQIILNSFSSAFPPTVLPNKRKRWYIIEEAKRKSMFCVCDAKKEIKDNFICFWFKFSFSVKLKLKFHFSFWEGWKFLQSKGMQLSDNKGKIFLSFSSSIYFYYHFIPDFLKTSSFRHILISYYYIPCCCVDATN